MCRNVAIGLVVALVATNVFWLVKMVDTAVTLEHHATEVKRQRARVALLANLVRDVPREADAGTAYRLLQARYPNEIVKHRGDTVEVGELRFEYRGGALAAVTPF